MRIDRNSVAVRCVEELLGILTDMHRVSAFSRVNSLYWCIHVRPSCYSTVFSVYALHSLSGLLSGRTIDDDDTARQAVSLTFTLYNRKNI